MKTKTSIKKSLSRFVSDKQLDPSEQTQCKPSSSNPRAHPPPQIPMPQSTFHLPKQTSAQIFSKPTIPRYIETRQQNHFLNAKYSNNQSKAEAFTRHMRYHSNLSLSKQQNFGKPRNSKNSSLMQTGAPCLPEQKFPRKPEFSAPKPFRHSKHKSELPQPRVEGNNFTIQNAYGKPQIIINNFLIADQSKRKNILMKSTDGASPDWPLKAKELPGRVCRSPASSSKSHEHLTLTGRDGFDQYYLGNYCVKSPKNKNEPSNFKDSLEISAAQDPAKRLNLKLDSKKKLHPIVESFRLSMSRREFS